MTTVFHANCDSKKESNPYKSTDGKGNLQSNFEIAFHIDYGTKDVWQAQSGGTTVMLHTINKAAADMFEIGKQYSFEVKEVV